MKDTKRTKQALIEELTFLRQGIKDLEQSQASRKKTEDVLQNADSRYRHAAAVRGGGSHTGSKAAELSLPGLFRR